jgi:hypothetical protein
MSAMDKQVGGDHYKSMAIQPSTYCERNKFTHLQSQTIKYVSRWKDYNGTMITGKGGLQDIEKAIHCLEMMKDEYYAQAKEYAYLQQSGSQTCSQGQQTGNLLGPEEGS